MQDKLLQFKEKLKIGGLKMTSQRLAVYQVLIQTKTHPDVNYIYSKVQELFPMISLATVYKTLESFKKAGLVLALDSGDELKHYDGNAMPHPHIICIKCNKIDDLNNLKTDEAKKMNKIISGESNYKVVDGFVSFYGYCPECRGRI